jgi:serine protease AprX
MTTTLARRRTSQVVLMTVLAASLSASLTRPAEGTTWESVIVSGTVGSLDAVRDAVRSVGGEIRDVLPIIHGVSAKVPARSLGALRVRGGVRSVSPDTSGRLLAVDPALGYDVVNDEGSLYFSSQVVRARTGAWQDNITGKGVDIALIDSGVAAVKGLTSGNVVHGPDLSFESQVPELEHKDTYGHGTHMASIIVGRDQAMSGSNYAASNTSKFNGIAPDARLVSVKVANNAGAADVSQVIAAIDWVTQNKNVANLNIRVLNLSYGANSNQPFAVDPLAYAAENAWRAGIVVVVAGGNNGSSRTELTSPAYDPLVLAVGADNPNTTTAVTDDTLATFSQPGTAARHVDVLAPGMHTLGLRVPGSRLDQQNPQAVVGSRFFRGTGTSQAAAVVSGLAALYLSKYPTATPDAVKRVLMATANTNSTSHAQVYPGLGVPNLNNAMTVSPPNARVQAATGATGTGSLEAARGGSYVNDGTSDLTGERDIFGHAWDSQQWAAASAAGNTWTSGSWNGNAWTGTTWTGNTWTGTTWTGNTWTGNTWTGNTWTGNTWTGNTWTGEGWTGNTWTGNTWTGNAWTNSIWSGETWN